MTLPLFLCLHLVYGTLMGLVLFPRMRAEGEVLGPPLLLTLAPPALLTSPIGAVLLRYAGGWFCHGFFLGDGNATYERFHLGLLLAVGGGALVCTLLGVVNVVWFQSRTRPALARAPIYLAAVVAVAVVAVDFHDVVTIVGTNGRHLWSHPVGLLSVATAMILGGFVVLTKARFAALPART